MKLVVFALISIFAYGVEPKPIPKEKHEEISQKMILLQQKQMISQQATAIAKDAIAKAQNAEAEAKAAETEYLEKVVKPLQKEFNAPGCEIKIDKTWECPKSEDKKK